MHLHKRSKTFSLKNISIFTGLFLLIAVVLGYGFFDLTTDSFKDQLTKTSFIKDCIIIQPQDGKFYKINKDTNKKWFAKAGLFITVTDKKIVFTDTKDKSYLMNDYYNLWIPNNEQYQLVLSDGSEIKLNENTHIRFNNNRLSKKSQVFLLKGEAFFNVAHKENNTFKIKASEMKVEVYGTSFNMKNNKEDKYTSVALVEGSVKVTNSLQNSTYIKPGERAVINNDTKRLSVENINLNKSIFTNSSQYYFKDEKLETILERLTLWHNKNFEFKGSVIKTIRFTGSIKKEEGIIPFLKILKYTENISYSIKDNTVILNKNKPN